MLPTAFQIQFAGFDSVFILYVAKKIDFKVYLNLSSPYSYLEKIKKLYEVPADKNYMKYFALKFAIPLLTWVCISLIFLFLGYATV